MRHELFALDRASVISDGRLTLTDFNLHVYQGHIHGIICDSIDEQKAISNLFYGNCLVTGTMRFSRKQIKKASTSLFEKYFFIIGNTTVLLDNLTISENIALFQDNSFLISSQKIHSEAVSLLERFKISLDLSKKICDLSAFERIEVSLLKAFSEHRKIVVFIQLSEVLSEQELELLTPILHTFQTFGMTFIVIDSLTSTALWKVEDILVVKNRTSVACFKADFFNQTELMNYMMKMPKSIPPNLSLEYSAFNDEDPESMIPVFEAVDMTTEGLFHLSFSLIKGELLKIYCKNQKTINNFQHLVYGEDQILFGSLILRNTRINKFSSVKDAMKHGLLWCPEAPYNNMLLPNLSVRDNLLLGLSLKIPSIWASTKYTRSIDQYLNENLGTGYSNLRVHDLPPDILQIIAYTRILLYAPSVVILEKPFTDTDLHMRNITLTMIDKLQNRGISIILLTMTPSDLYVKDGDILYLSDGKLISEEEMYLDLY